MEQEQLEMILKAISDARQESTCAVGALATIVAELKGSTVSRLDAVEEYIASDKKWSRVKNSLVPAYALIHAVLAHFGIRA